MITLIKFINIKIIIYAKAVCLLIIGYIQFNFVQNGSFKLEIDYLDIILMSLIIILGLSGITIIIKSRFEIKVIMKIITLITFIIVLGTLYSHIDLIYTYYTIENKYKEGYLIKIVYIVGQE